MVILVSMCLSPTQQCSLLTCFFQLRMKTFVWKTIIKAYSKMFCIIDFAKKNAAKGKCKRLHKENLHKHARISYKTMSRMFIGLTVVRHIHRADLLHNGCKNIFKKCNCWKFLTKLNDTKSVWSLVSQDAVGSGLVHGASSWRLAPSWRYLTWPNRNTVYASVTHGNSIKLY